MNLTDELDNGRIDVQDDKWSSVSQNKLHFRNDAEIYFIFIIPIKGIINFFKSKILIERASPGSDFWFRLNFFS